MGQSFRRSGEGGGARQNFKYQSGPSGQIGRSCCRQLVPGNSPFGAYDVKRIRGREDRVSIRVDSKRHE